MLSSKFKSWVESHLTHRNSKSKSSGSHNKSSGKLTAQLHHHGEGSILAADRIAHPASSLVSLTSGSLHHPHSSGRSNAALVIRLQNDFSSSSSGMMSPLSRQRPPSWTSTTSAPSPVVTSSPWGRSRSPPTSPLLLLHHQADAVGGAAADAGQPSPTGSDWTSTGRDSGIGRAGTDSSIISSAPSIRLFGGQPSVKATPSLSSPESAYSTGCSADDGGGLSPNGLLLLDDDVLRASSSSSSSATPTPGIPPDAEPIGQHWSRIQPIQDINPAGSGGNLLTLLNSPRIRPTIRTNPWLPVRNSLTSYSSTDRSSWMTDAVPNSETTPYWSETSLPTSWPDASSSSLSTLPKETDLLLPAHPPHHESSSGETTGDGITKVLMDEPKVNNSTFDRFQQQQQPGIDPSSPSVDDQYTLLIRQTEEILLELEKDELLLRMNNNKVEETVVLPASRPASLTGRRSQIMSRRSAAAARRYEIFSSSESSDCESFPSTGWKRPGSAQRLRNQRARSQRASVTSRFAGRQNGQLVTPTPPPPPPPQRDCWLLNSQLASCTPDWTEGHERPPSPAPMDPHCHPPHWSSRPGSSYSSSSSRRVRQQQFSCPTSPAVRPERRQQTLLREQMRLESQIAFLRKQLKEVMTDDYYDDADGTRRFIRRKTDWSSPSSTSLFSDSPSS